MITSVRTTRPSGHSMTEAVGTASVLSRALSQCKYRRKRNRAAVPVASKARRTSARVAFYGFLFTLLWASSGAAQTVPGTVISNTATLRFATAGGAVTQPSNPVELTARAPRSTAQLDLIKISPGGGQSIAIGASSCALAGGGSVPLAPPVLLDGAVLDLQQPQSVDPGDLLHSREPLFVRVADSDQNQDGRAIDTLVVTVASALSADEESVTLVETGPNTGLFTGYLPTGPAPAVAADCILQVSSGDTVEVRYRDPQDANDVAQAGALVDPLGIVFDSVTGAPVDGAVVRLIDVLSGLPATVLGDDGVSVFPAQLVSGGTVTDTGGTIYQFAAGQFRFPLIAPGTYRLEVVPPAAYSAPSAVPLADLAALPGGPFALGSASYGDPFVVMPGPVINIDIPIDPGATELFLQKTVPVATAAPGDFLAYTLTLENTGNTVAARNVAIDDTLPFGFRLIPESLRIDGVAAPAPEFGARAVDVRIPIGDVAPGQRVTVNYVVEVTTLVRDKEAINLATARADNGLQSNTARASVRLRDDLFGEQAFLIGRVVDGDCAVAGTKNADGVAGVRVYLEDGRYALTDDTGRYHFENVRAGNHVVQLDVDTVPAHMEIAPCVNHGRFTGRAYSQFVDLARGALWRADFYLREVPAATGAINLALNSQPHDAAHEVHYLMELGGQIVPVSQLKAMVMLPDGVEFIPGSVNIDGLRAPDPASTGQALTFTLGERAGNWQQRIEFDARIAPLALGEFVTKAVLTYDTPAKSRQRTPLADNRFVREPPKTARIERVFKPRFETRKAELSSADRATISAALEEFKHAGSIGVRVIGHTDNVAIAPQNRHEYADNMALSAARAQAVAAFVRERLSLTPAQVSYAGVADSRPLASNATAQGRAINRRVELMIWGDAVTTPGAVTATKSDSGLITAATLDQSVKVQASAAPTRPVAPVARDWFADTSWLDTADADVAMLMPAADANPAVGSLKVVVKHAGDHSAQLSLNGAPVSALNFDGVTRSANKKVAASRWRGVDIAPGTNLLELRVIDANGQIVQSLQRSVHFAGGPVRATLATAESVLIADGRTAPVLTLALFDRDGRPARPQSVGVFRVDPPYQSQWQIDAERDNALIAVGDRNPVYSVDADGKTRIQLAPTGQAGEVTLHLRFENNREEEIRAWLKPAARDWILVALAQGTVGHNDFSDNAQEARDAGVDENYYSDGRVAFFAKGRVKGEHLLTLAYDSDGDEDDARSRLFGEVDPDRFYTLYGDATEQRFDAASAEKLYVKIERGEYYALFGDYDTNLNVTELSRYNRSFNGFKAEHQGQRVGFNAFATRTDQAFIKDELRGDGTSGLYRLTRQPIIVNSEKIAIEIRDRFRSEEIIETRNLMRHLDYDIDYLNGTLFFKQPIPVRDPGFNPVYIVADYESRDGRDEALTAGGRASLKLGERLVVGASAVREENAGAQSELFGADLRYAINDVTELRAEVATTNAQQNGLQGDGDAYLVELRHQGQRADGKVYVREQDAGFGLGQQRGTEGGMRKFGLDGRLRLSKRLNLNAELFQQRNLETGTVRDVVQAEVRYQHGRGTLSTGLRSASDAPTDGPKQRSEQAFVNASLNVLGDRLTVRAGADFNLGGGAQNIDYPTRTTLGLDYKLGDKATLFAEHEITDGADIATDTTRVGVQATPWEKARINATVNQETHEYGPRVFANVGLIQGWQVSERWTVDAGLDHSNTIVAADTARVNESAPLASGEINGDFSSAFVGALYRSEFWSATSRLEYRRSDEETRAGVFFGMYREEVAGVGFSADAQLFDSERIAGPDTRNAEVRLGWAFRPSDSRWTLLNRLDAVYEDIELPGSQNDTWKLINNFSANYATGRSGQLSFRYGAKFTRSNVGDDTYTGFTDLMGAQWRRNLGTRFDIGMHGNVRHSWRSDIYDYNLGIEGGVSVADNTWLSLGYNVLGFEDDDFIASGYVAQGPYLRFRIKADQDSLATLRRRLPFTTRNKNGASAIR